MMCDAVRRKEYTQMEIAAKKHLVEVGWRGYVKKHNNTSKESADRAT